MDPSGMGVELYMERIGHRDDSLHVLYACLQGDGSNAKGPFPFSGSFYLDVKSWPKNTKHSQQ